MSPPAPSPWRRSLSAAVLLGVSTLAWAADPVVVPEVVDLPETVARGVLEEAGFAVEAQDVAGVPAGTVASQRPGGFSRAEPGTRVRIDVRRGNEAPSPAVPPEPAGGPSGVPPPPPAPPPAPPPEEAAPLPDLVGRTEDDALARLADYRVIVTPVDGEGAPEGQVVRMEPAAGTRLAAGRDVSIYVAREGAPPLGAVAVPNVTGLDQAAAEQQVLAMGLTSLPHPIPSDPANAGRVVAQEPTPGALVARGSTVLLTVGRPRPSALLEGDVPTLLGLEELTARARLAEAGYGVVTRDTLAPGSQGGRVLEQSPRAGTRLLRGRDVVITVGRTLMLPVKVPDTLGQEAATADRTLRDAGFVVERTTALSLPSSEGRVVAQEPPGTVTAIRGSTVRLTIGRAQAALPVAVPDLVGRTEAEARAAAVASGLALRVRPAAGGPGTAGRVRAQAPPAGASLPRGGEVEVEVVGAAGGPGASLVVPSWVGMDLARAQADASARGLRVGVVHVAGAPPGQVLRQVPLPGSLLPPGGSVTLTVARAAATGLAAVQILQPSDRVFVARHVALTFLWNPVPEAEDYEFEAVMLKDDTWVRVANEIVRGVERRPTGRPKAGTYRWHVRARRGGGHVLGPWSEWRRVTVY